jgi:hypothetical protein
MHGNGCTRPSAVPGRAIRVLLVVLVAMIAGPFVSSALVICHQYPDPGGCETICDFYGPRGEHQGSITYGWCR